jgi:hypothetical protein
MIHHSVGASRRIARVIAAVGGPLWAIIAGANPASAGSAPPGHEPPLRGSYCNEQDLAPSQLGCARISGYITAGAHFEPDEPIGGPANLFAPLDGPGIAGAGVSGFKTIGAPLGGETFLPPLSSSGEAR